MNDAQTLRREAARDLVARSAPLLLSALEAAAVQERAGLYDFFVVVYDSAAHAQVAAQLGQAVCYPGEELGILVIPATDEARALRLLGLPPPPPGEGAAVGALLEGEALTTRLRCDAKGRA